MIPGGVRVLNVGLPLIVDGVDADSVVQLDWRPPAFGDVEAARIMASLDTEHTAAANERAVAAIDCASCGSGAELAANCAAAYTSPFAIRSCNRTSSGLAPTATSSCITSGLICM